MFNDNGRYLPEISWTLTEYDEKSQEKKNVEDKIQNQAANMHYECVYTDRSINVNENVLSKGENGMMRISV